MLTDMNRYAAVKAEIEARMLRRLQANAEDKELLDRMAIIFGVGQEPIAVQPPAPVAPETATPSTEVFGEVSGMQVAGDLGLVLGNVYHTPIRQVPLQAMIAEIDRLGNITFGISDFMELMKSYFPNVQNNTLNKTVSNYIGHLYKTNVIEKVSRGVWRKVGGVTAAPVVVEQKPVVLQYMNSTPIRPIPLQALKDEIDRLGNSIFRNADFKELFKKYYPKSSDDSIKQTVVNYLAYLNKTGEIVREHRGLWRKAGIVVAVPVQPASTEPDKVKELGEFITRHTNSANIYKNPVEAILCFSGDFTSDDVKDMLRMYYPRFKTMKSTLYTYAVGYCSYLLKEGKIILAGKGKGKNKRRKKAYRVKRDDWMTRIAEKTAPIRYDSTPVDDRLKLSPLDRNTAQNSEQAIRMRQDLNYIS